MPKAPPLTQEQKDRINYLYRKKWTTTEICKDVGCNNVTALRYAPLSVKAKLKNFRLA